MAFKNKNMSVIAYANGFTLWHYKSDDNMQIISMNGYFMPIHSLMAIGDIIIINAQDGTAIKAVKKMDSSSSVLEVGNLD